MKAKKLLWNTCFLASLSFILLSPSLACSAPDKAWPSTMTISVSDPGSAGNMLGVALSKVIEEKLKIRATITVAGTEERLRLVAQKEADIGITLNDTTLFNAVRGIGPFAKGGKQPVRYFVFHYPLMLNIISKTKSQIKSIPDLRGKRISYILRGSPGEYVIPALLEFHKMKPTDIIGLKMGTAAEGTEAMLAGASDACTRVMARQGVAAIKEVALNNDIAIMSLTQPEVDYVRGKYPYLGQYTMPPGIYKGQNYPVLNITEGFQGIVHKDMPEDLVYALIKLLLDSTGPTTKGDFTKYHPDLDWTLDSQKAAFNLAPFHPGVVRYLKERKFWTAEMDKMQQDLLKAVQ